MEATVQGFSADAAVSAAGATAISIHVLRSTTVRLHMLDGMRVTQQMIVRIELIVGLLLLLILLVVVLMSVKMSLLMLR